MSSNKISDLESLIGSFIPKTHKFVDAKLHKLTSSGDNYGSVLLAVDIVVRDEEDQEQHISAVAKKPPHNELIQEMFNTQCTFPIEVGFYQTITKCLRQFQKEKGIKCLVRSFPQFYAARVCRDPSNGRITEDSALLMKNIKKEGFETLDRTIGFNLPQARLILEKMAEIHAIVAALRLQQPQVFQENFLPFFTEFETFAMDEESNYKMVKVAMDVVKDDEICKDFLPQLLDMALKSSFLNQKKNDPMVAENQYFSLVHSDLWTNNIMVKIIDGEIKDVKFIDYQLYEYSSLVRDVVFFLFSSVCTEVLKQNCDDLFLHYYTSFIDWWGRLGCDVRDFSFEGFMQEMKIMVQKYEFFHIMTMLPPIYATAENTKDVEQLEMDNLIFYGSEPSEIYREKACFIVRDFIRRGWVP